MIEAILSVLGCLFISAVGAVLGFFGGLGDEAPVFLFGIAVFCFGIFSLGYTIYGWFA